MEGHGGPLGKFTRPGGLVDGLFGPRGREALERLARWNGSVQGVCDMRVAAACAIVGARSESGLRGLSCEEAWQWLRDYRRQQERRVQAWLMQCAYERM